MNYLAQSPGPPLDAFIESFWWLSDAPGHGREQVVPSGTLELVVNLHEDEFRIYDGQGEHPRRFRGAMVSGAYRRPFVIDTREHASIVGVHFRPGGALPLVGAPPGEIGGAHVELEALWGVAAAELRERLAAASTAERRFAVLEQALLERLRRPARRHPAVAIAIRELDRPHATVSEVRERLGLSHRRFIEIFAREVGIAPKLFARIRRFQRALQAAERSVAPRWARLALSCGYYDQAHLTHDFSELAGMSPAELAGGRSDQMKVNHILVPNGRGSISSKTAGVGAPKFSGERK
jgi:AraC-like DNA-binding protein